jgi:hypothetical protein
MRDFCFSSRNFEDEYRSLLEVNEDTQSRNDDEINKKGHFSTVPLKAKTLYHSSQFSYIASTDFTSGT